MDDLVTSEDHVTEGPGITKDYTTEHLEIPEDDISSGLGTSKHYTTKHPDTHPEGPSSVTNGLLTPIRIILISLAATTWQLHSLLDWLLCGEYQPRNVKNIMGMRVLRRRM